MKGVKGEKRIILEDTEEAQQVSNVHNETWMEEEELAG